MQRGYKANRIGLRDFVECENTIRITSTPRSIYGLLCFEQLKG